MLVGFTLINIGYYSLAKPLYGKHYVQQCEGYGYGRFS
jgi:hypothetical protein